MAIISFRPIPRRRAAGVKLFPANTISGREALVFRRHEIQARFDRRRRTTPLPALHRSQWRCRISTYRPSPSAGTCGAIEAQERDAADVILRGHEYIPKISISRPDQDGLRTLVSTPNSSWRRSRRAEATTGRGYIPRRFSCQPMAITADRSGLNRLPRAISAEITPSEPALSIVVTGSAQPGRDAVVFMTSNCLYNQLSHDQAPPSTCRKVRPAACRARGSRHYHVHYRK